MGMQTGLLVLLFALLVVQEVCCDDSLQTKCAQEFPKLSNCIDFSTGKADSPSKDCCGSVTAIRGSVPECLCYIIQQTHNGLPTTKQLGLQFTRLLQLPSACNLANASVTDCPKLLNLSPSSPDNAIFTNTTKASSTPSGSATTTTPTASNAVMNKFFFARIFATSAISAILSSFSLAA